MNLYGMADVDIKKIQAFRNIDYSFLDLLPI